MIRSMRYSVYESFAYGRLSRAAELEASSDREALKQAREILPHGPGELRESGRVVCRFGRSSGFLLQS
jgi:hypothetical protein